jgi:hypothetical protein
VIVLWVWVGAVVFAAVILAFCGYELVWKSRRLQDDLEKLAGLQSRLTALQGELDTARTRMLAVQQVAEGAGS